MKRFVQAGIISAVLAAMTALPASCTWMPDSEEQGDARLAFHFVRTKADAMPDTNRFILKVRSAVSGDILYEGLYGDRPATLQVPSGTYTVSAMSCDFPAPAFESPLYGDEKEVVARSGETLAVGFLCTLRNSGVRIEVSDRFRSRYPGKLLLKQTEGQLDYGYAESRTAWMFPGEVSFCYNDGKADNILFRRTLGAGEIRTLSLDATSDESGSAFSIAVDTTATRTWEQVVVGAESTGDGLTMATAYSVAELAAADCAGDTVWVWGYVVGTILAENTVDFSCDTTSVMNNLAIAASAATRDPASCAGIYLSKAAHKNALNLKDPANRATVLHHKIYVQGKAYNYKKFPALTNLCQYQLE